MSSGIAPLFAQQAERGPAAAAPANAVTKARYGSWGVNLAARDLSVRPGDDFWRHTNSLWFRNNPIPADRAGWGVGNLMGEDVNRQLRAIVEGGGTDPVSRQVSDFYFSWMDEAGIEARGTAPLRPYLARISAVRTRDDLLRLFMTPGYTSPITAGIIADPSNPTRYIAGVVQSGLGLPGREYYLAEGEQYARYRSGYRNYVMTMLRLAGIDDPAGKADAIIALERRIAQAHWTPERSRNILEMYNPMNRAQLAALAPQFNWPLLLAHRGFGNVETIIAANSSAITDIGRLLDEVPLETWRDYLRFHFINSWSSALPRAFDEAQFNFFSGTLRGVQQQRERWERGLGLLNGTLGEAVGRIYMERHFSADSRRQMSELIVNLREAFAERLSSLEWMDEPTRREALAKLEAFNARIGGPERFVDYSPIRVDRADLLGNRIRAAEFQWQLQLARLPNPVDRTLWGMTPQTINASYSPLANQITFPAAILQAPFFDPTADVAVNYGAIGAIIGHEIGHGFDDQGRRFDARGQVRDWWTPVSAQRFAERTARLVEQYGQYEAVPGQRVNGRLTLGENIGDLGGLEMAYSAYRRHVAQRGEPPVRDGLTGDQRFFLAYAQAWGNQMREDALRQQVLTDPHSPAEFRVNGVVRNVDAWYRAFNVQPGHRLYLPPEQRVRIW
jgi:endothelin-converting enzyme/putative endopeptidase